MPRFSTRYKLPQRSAPAPVLPDMSRSNAINARLGQFPLENEARQAQMDAAQAREAKARYDLSKQIETDRQRTAFYNGLNELEQNLNQRGYKVGSQEHAEAFASYAHEFPLARSSSDVQQTLKVHALVADDQAALKQRINALSPPPEKIVQRYSRVQGDIRGHQDLSKVEEAANIAAGKANVPYSKAPELHANQTEAALLEQSYPNLAQSGNSEQPQPAQPAAPVVQQPSNPATSSAVIPAPTIAPNDTVATPTPTHLGTYNPATGEFE